ncbi:hypothetical protein T548_0062 [Lactococcus phage phiL47]|uniref:Uncharacterized protein n=1 Tax=Lactococcus phage phiL47 TaxID=1412875 RepID=V9VG94_9CAUD|nr:hypothetical protein T548_0062 [Lactococcus phage phiL47]AHC94140.1 hypothetical protein T548_0062 [Lactococcus phage phiL47]
MKTNKGRKEIRKHFTQMNEQELEIVKNKIKSSVNGDVNSVNIVPHAFDNLFKRLRKGRDINTYKVMLAQTLIDFTPIEFKRIYNGVNLVEERSVLRGNRLVNEESIVLVYSITHRKIITVWINSLNDMHSTLDTNLYDSEMVIY